jgi:anti-sigma B factor antagonist
MTVGTASQSHEIYQDGNELYVLLKGRVVLEELDALKHSVLPRITRDLEHVYVDLRNVDYVDSAGLGLLIGFKMTSKMNGARITLMDPNKTVADVLNISKIDGIFEFLNGRDAQVLRDRLAHPDFFKAGDNPTGAGYAAEGHMPTVNADGTLLTEDNGGQKREAVEEYCRRAVEHMRQGDYENSIECYKGALDLDPDYLPALNNLAIVYEKQPGWHSLATEKWNRVLEISRQRNDEKHMDRAERHLADLKQ